MMQDVARAQIKAMLISNPSPMSPTMKDVADLTKAFRELEAGDHNYGLRLLEKVLDDMLPSWRTL